MMWTTDVPTNEGMYVLARRGKNGPRMKVVNVHAGYWQKSQCPQWLYADNKQITTVKKGMWLPLPPLRQS